MCCDFLRDDKVKIDFDYEKVIFEINDTNVTVSFVIDKVMTR